MTDALVISDDAHVRTIRLNRPEQLNAFGGDMMPSLDQVLRAADDAPDVHVVVLTGTGRAFSSGADLADAARLQGNPQGSMEVTSTVIRQIVGMATPVVVAMNGLAAGVAAGIVAAADIVVAQDDSYLLLPFARIGLIPDGGTTLSFAASMGRARAMRAALLAEPVSAQDAYALGLISEVCSAAELPGRVRDIADKLAAQAPTAIAETKAAVNAATISGMDAALDVERDVQTKLLAGAEFAEGSTAFRERRAPNYRGAGQ